MKGTKGVKGVKGMKGRRQLKADETEGADEAEVERGRREEYLRIQGLPSVGQV
jgi:hypothetical protein